MRKKALFEATNRGITKYMEKWLKVNTPDPPLLKATNSSTPP
jgi:hypothetical protein